jgi:hypothetical protein
VVIAHAGVRFEQAGHQIGKIVGPRADEFRQRITLVIALTQKDTFGPQAWSHEAVVLN